MVRRLSLTTYSSLSLCMGSGTVSDTASFKSGCVATSVSCKCVSSPLRFIHVMYVVVSDLTVLISLVYLLSPPSVLFTLSALTLQCVRY